MDMKIKASLMVALAAALWAGPGLGSQGGVTQVAEVKPNVTGTLAGLVRDRATGQPLADVYVRQQDSLNAVFSNAEGRFSLSVLRNGPQIVVFAREGYESISLAFRPGMPADLGVELEPILVYRSQLPPAHASEIAPERKVFGNQFSAFYQFHHGSQSFQGSQIAGWAFNELGLNGHLQFEPWMVRLQFFRTRIPIDVAGFDTQPVFYVNTMQARLGAGLTWTLHDRLGLYLGSDLVYQRHDPDNKSNQDKQPVLYTGSPLDLAQNRAVLGANAMLGWAVTDFLTVLPEIGIYPLGLYADSQVAQWMGMGELGATLRFQLMPGLALTGRYHRQMWLNTSIFDSADYFGIGLAIDPWKMSAQTRN